MFRKNMESLEFSGQVCFDGKCERALRPLSRAVDGAYPCRAARVQINEISYTSRMDWLAEARAVIEDVKPYVSSIAIAKGMESTNMRIYFDLTILEGVEFVVSMDSSGFSIWDESGETSDDTVYETINSLLDANSSRYREEFSKALASKMKLLEQ